MSRLYALKEFCEAERDWLVDEIETLVALESPTTDKAAVDRCGQTLAARLERIGGRVTRLSRSDAGDHLLAEFGCGTSQILLLGHFDTVWPVGQIGRMPIAHAGGRLHGPGVFDMKAGIALGMLAIRSLVETGAPLTRRVVMLWTSDEETGSRTSRGAIEDEARRSEAVLVLEPSLPGGAVKTSRKGCGDFEVRVSGVSAHAGVDPGRGASAIHELARQILALERMGDPERGISVNVGVVSGGTRSNVVADQARASVDVRVPTAADAVRIEAWLRALAPADGRTGVTVTGGFGRPPLERTPLVERLYEQAKLVASELGMPLEEGSTGGGSDGNFTAALGVATLDGLGAIGDGAHALHEHVEVASLPGRAALVAGLIARLGAGDAQ
jgi:glutamate carboxypeptidase